METQSFFELVQAHLKQPEYLHSVLRVFPVEGLALGMLALIIALVLKSRPAQITALILVFVCSAMAWPVFCPIVRLCVTDGDAAPMPTRPISVTTKRPPGVPTESIPKAP